MLGREGTDKRGAYIWELKRKSKPLKSGQGFYYPDFMVMLLIYFCKVILTQCYGLKVLVLQKNLSLNCHCNSFPFQYFNKFTYDFIQSCLFEALQMYNKLFYCYFYRHTVMELLTLFVWSICARSTSWRCLLFQLLIELVS